MELALLLAPGLLFYVVQPVDLGDDLYSGFHSSIFSCFDLNPTPMQAKPISPIENVVTGLTVQGSD